MFTSSSVAHREARGVGQARRVLGDRAPGRGERRSGEPERRTHHAHGSDDLTARIADGCGHGRDAALHRVLAHGHAVRVDVRDECPSDGGAAAGHGVPEPADVPDGVGAGLHGHVHRGAVVGRLGEVGRLAERLGQRGEHGFGEAGERRARREVAGDAQQFGSRHPGAVGATDGEAGGLERAQLPERGAGAELDGPGQIGERQPVRMIGDLAHEAQAAVGRTGGVECLRHVAQYGRLCRQMETPGNASTAAHVTLQGRGLTIDDVVAVARRHAPVRLADEARAAMERSAALVDGFVAGETPVYGVTTGFGSLAATVIPAERTAELQVALVRSHATGMGDTVEPEVVRALLLLRARSLAMAHSGVRPEIVDLQLALLAEDITPVVREHGSLGASGDLAPLSHCALSLIGEGEVWGPDDLMVPTSVAFARGRAPAR